MLAVSSGVPVTTCTPLGLHSSTAPLTNSATAGGSEGMEARDRTPTLAPTPPRLKEKKALNNLLLFLTLTSEQRKAVTSCGSVRQFKFTMPCDWIGCNPTQIELTETSTIQTTLINQSSLLSIVWSSLCKDIFQPDLPHSFPHIRYTQKMDLIA